MEGGEYIGDCAIDYCGLRAVWAMRLFFWICVNRIDAQSAISICYRVPLTPHPLPLFPFGTKVEQISAIADYVESSSADPTD